MLPQNKLHELLITFIIPKKCITFVGLPLIRFFSSCCDCSIGPLRTQHNVLESFCIPTNSTAHHMLGSSPRVLKNIDCFDVVSLRNLNKYIKTKSKSMTVNSKLHETNDNQMTYKWQSHDIFSKFLNNPSDSVLKDPRSGPGPLAP